MEVVGCLFLLVGLVALRANRESDRDGWWSLAMAGSLVVSLQPTGEPLGPALSLLAAVVAVVAWPAGAAGWRVTGDRLAALLGLAVCLAAGGLLAGVVPRPWAVALLEAVGFALALALGRRANCDRCLLAAFATLVLAGVVGLAGHLLPGRVAPELVTGLRLAALLVLAIALINQELTERRVIVDRLGRSEEHFRMIFEHSGVAMALLTPRGGFVRVNPAMIQLFGYQVEELQGRLLVDLTGNELLKTSRTEQGLDLPEGVYERERQFRRKDGGLVIARVLRVPLRDERGEVRFLVAVVLDVTERRQAEEALAVADASLRQERDFWVRVVGTSAAMILVLDVDGTLVRCNDAAGLLLHPHEPPAPGLPLAELFPPALVPTLRTQLGRLAAQAEPVAFETALTGRDGGEVWVAWRAARTHADGHVVLTGVDVTDQRLLTEQLRHAQKMECLGTLVGGIAHDFNNQLAVVLGNLELLLDEMRVGETPEELLDAERAARRCAEMTHSLLAFSRRKSVQLRRLNPASLLGELGPLLQRVLPATIQVEVACSPKTWHIQADSTQLHQVLMNLAINARDAMPEGGRLLLQVHNRELAPDATMPHPAARPGRFVALTVRDTGTGMTAEVKARVFEPFFTTKEVGKGTGLGLPVVFGIVQAHQGWITLESESGRGTTFEIWLPAIPPANEPPTAAADAPPVRGGTETILVVDDEEMVRGLARSVLERWSYRVLTARNGDEALATLRQRGGEVRLVLLDLTMPGLTGLQLIPHVRRVAPDVAIVTTSGHGDPALSLSAGSDAFLAKPYRPDELVRLVRQVLDSLR